MKSNIIEILFIVLATAAGTYFITKYTIKPVRQEILKTDTVMVKADTVFKDRPYAVTLPGNIDTVFYGNTDSVKSIIARADTVLLQDSSRIRVSYFFPPENYFDVQLDLKERVVTLTREIMKYVPEDAPWYDHFIIGAGAVLAAIVSVFLLFK